MAQTTYVARAQRFCRQYRSPNLSARWSSLSSAAEAAERIQSERWLHITSDLAPQLSPHLEAEGEPDTLDYLDAYSLCAEHADSLHRAYAGCVAYRIELPDAAAGLDLVSLSARVFSDPYNVYGARIAAAKSASALPDSDWTVIREGLDADGVEGVDYQSAVAPRTTNELVTIAYGANELVTLELSEGVIISAVGKYLWVYLSLEEYAYARSGWLEGSSRIEPIFTLVFSAAIAGYAEGDSIGGGYPSSETVLAVAGVAAAPIIPSVSSHTATWPTLEEPKYNTIHQAGRVTYFATLDTSEKARSAYAQLLAGAPGNNQSATAPDGENDGKLWTHKRLTGSSGYSPLQPGLAAGIMGTDAATDLVVAAASYYMIPCMMPRAAMRNIILLNGASALDLGGVGIQLTPWFIASPSDLSTAGTRFNHCFIMLALTRQRTFWLGDTSSVSGTVSNGEGTPVEYSLSATRLGPRIILPDEIAADQEIAIRLDDSIPGDGFIVLVPWVIDPGPAAPAEMAGPVGLGTLYALGTSSGGASQYGSGWLPGIRLE